MKKSSVCIALLLTASLALPLGAPVSGEAGDLILSIRQQNLIRSSDAGATILRAINAPVFDQNGGTVGSANVTSVVDHPDMPFFPTFIEVAGRGQRFFFNRLVSRDGQFRHSFGFSGPATRPTTFFRTGIVAPVDLPQGNTPLTFSVGRHFTQPFGVTFNHVFDFTSPRVQGTSGTTTFAYRPTATWSLSQSFASKTVGQNFSFSFANSTQTGSANFLSLDRQNGAVVFCSGSPQVCGVAGVGGFNNIFGYAESRLPVDLGVPGDAGSSTIFTDALPGSQPAVVTCPPGFTPPAPTDVLATVSFLPPLNFTYFVSWGSVVCADRYRVELLRDGTVVRTEIVPSTNSTVVLSSAIANAVRVTAISPEPRAGASSEGAIVPVQ